MRGSSSGSSATATTAVRVYRGHGRRSRNGHLTDGGRGHLGVSVVGVVMMFIVLAGFVSLAVDVGRIRLAREELQTAADAAACAGARTFPDTNGAQEVIDNTDAAAFENPCIDNEDKDKAHLNQRTNPGVVLEPGEDVAFGLWDANTRTFTELTDNSKTATDERLAANAVRANARRLSKRSNPVQLMIAPIVGVFSSDVERVAVATIKGGPQRFGFVGLDWVNAAGTKAKIDSVDIKTMTFGDNGWVGSNGNINLGNGDVYGDARPGVTGTLSQGPTSLITGWHANLDQPLSYPAVPFVSPAFPANDGSITPSGAVVAQRFVPNGNASYNFPSGTYVFKGSRNNPAWKQAGGGVMTINAPANVYIDGDFSMTGGLLVIKGNGKVNFYVNGNFTQGGTSNIDNQTHDPSKFTVTVTKAGTTVSMKGTIQTYAHVYAPLSDVTIDGTPGFYGWAIGKTLTFKGNPVLHDDMSLMKPGNWKISLVK
jgi:hypothetical protein